MNTSKIYDFHPSITRCELRLQHTSRNTEPDWLAADLYLYSGEERRRIIFFDSGSEEERIEISNLLEPMGFTKIQQRLNQEWEHISYERKPVND
jgi:hypothetical protein